MAHAAEEAELRTSLNLVSPPLVGMVSCLQKRQRLLERAGREVLAIEGQEGVTENGVQVQQEVVTRGLVEDVMMKTGLAGATSEIDQEIERERGVTAQGQGTAMIDAARGVAQGRETLGQTVVERTEIESAIATEVRRSCQREVAAGMLGIVQDVTIHLRNTDTQKPAPSRRNTARSVSPPSAVSPRQRTRTGSPKRNDNKLKSDSRKYTPLPSIEPSDLGDADGAMDVSEDNGRPNDEDEDDEAQAQMRLVMGFGDFGSTKQKKVTGNNIYGVRKDKKTEYRQYMWMGFDESGLKSLLCN
ncbi:hypothetical protein GP486_004411 [Trichoglossum hirsutum]|uniref:U4/U6.U5 small nuclear ribonucleoprotein 27kDa protein domain-containing protein n=1 Tax=Trichoglossum hirsutum TaxID=265104 RepID=A0A9P8LBD8_9PEZI|nr:hypothetical protein GP486_004411 [Trichoglossum hirsutum]